MRPGLISMVNPDPTARNLRAFVAGAGIPRSMVLAWNAVPWFISDKSGKRIRAARGEDLEEGLDYLRLFLRQLPDLRAFAGLGRAAQRAWRRLAWPQHVPMIEASHPSNQVLNLDPAHGKVVREALGINLGEFAYQRRSDYDRTGEWRGGGQVPSWGARQSSDQAGCGNSMCLLWSRGKSLTLGARFVASCW